MHELNKIIARLCMLNQTNSLLNNDRVVAEWNEHYLKRVETTANGKMLLQEIKRVCEKYLLEKDIPAISSLLQKRGAEVHLKNRPENIINIRLNHDPLRIELVQNDLKKKKVVWEYNQQIT